MAYDVLSGETLHTAVQRLFENCVQQDSTSAVKCLVLLASFLTTEDAAVLKFVLKSLSTLVHAAKASVLGETFDSTLRSLAVMHESNDGVMTLIEEVRRRYSYHAAVPYFPAHIRAGRNRNSSEFGVFEIGSGQRTDSYRFFLGFPRAIPTEL